MSISSTLLSAISISFIYLKMKPSKSCISRHPWEEAQYLSFQLNIWLWNIKNLSTNWIPYSKSIFLLHIAVFWNWPKTFPFINALLQTSSKTKSIMRKLTPREIFCVNINNIYSFLTHAVSPDWNGWLQLYFLSKRDIFNFIS